MTRPEVSVIIAARNAAKTIPRAIRSALNEPEVVQVLVVDDASRDDTSSAARGADDASGRLSVRRLNINRGPAAARNLAIGLATAPYVAILDADDCYLEGRFRAIFAQADWDIAADNIVFVEERPDVRLPDIPSPRFEGSSRCVGLEQFILGNISRRGEHRGELGFLKPVVSRKFLDDHGLRYNEDMRLGEDYDLYLRALTKGARFRITDACGYLAVVRAESLSGRHSTEDLRRLADADLDLLATADLPVGSRKALARHERHVRDRYRLRRFLDLKADGGMTPALRYAFASLRNPLAIGRGVVSDKLADFRRIVAPASTSAQPRIRFLMPDGNTAGDE